MNHFVLYAFAALGIIETAILVVGGIIIVASIKNAKEE